MFIRPPAEQHLLQTVPLDLIGSAELARWNELIEHHHYLHNATLVGEVLRYVARDEQGEWCALLGYSSASLHLRARDEWLGWTAEQRERRRHVVTQNSHFLLLPGRACPNLASRVLKLAAQRLREDFPRVHGHPVVLVETFVDPTLYRGACYQAANWQPLGRTAGWARAGRDYYEKHDRPKELWVQPLAPAARGGLAAPTLPAGLASHERTPPPRNRLPVPALARLIEVFAQLPDLRRAAGTRHRLDAVLACASVGVLAGGRTLADLAGIAAEFSEPQLRALRCWLDPRTARRVAPSESTFQRTFGQIDTTLLDQLLGQWLCARDPAPRQIAVDGKALKGTRGLHLFSAFCGDHEAVLAQRAIPDKTNEIPQLAALLHDVPLEGVLVTADALHTQADTARQLVQERGADYLLVAKANQPSLRAACARLHPEPVFSHERDLTTQGHGRIETRAVQTRAVALGEISFPHVAQVARVDRRRKFPDGKIQTETVFVLSSRPVAQLGAAALGAALRTHWGIKNALHHRRDRTYDEDRCQCKNRGTAQVLASLRNLAIAARHHVAPQHKRQRSRTLPQLHRRLAAKPASAIALLAKPWIYT